MAGAAGLGVAAAKPKLISLAALASKWWLTATAGTALTLAVLGTTSYVRQARQPAAPTAAPVAEIAVPDDMFVPVMLASDEPAPVARWPVPSQAVKTFIGAPLKAGSIAWVIDGSEAMNPYYSTVHRLINTAVLQLEPDSQRFGVAIATAADPRVSNIDAATRDAYLRSKDVLGSVSPSSHADLASAFSAAVRQRPEQVMLVTASPIAPATLSQMRRQASAVGTTVDVIALGEHQRSLDRFARSTSGEYRFVSRDDLQTWANLVAQYGTLGKIEKERFGL